MICPKCGLDQPVAVECQRCGVIVQRFRPRAPVQAPPPPARVAAAVAVAQPAPVAQIVRTVLQDWSHVVRNPPPSLKKRAQFFQQLGRLAQSGVPLDEALATLLPIVGTDTLLGRAVQAMRLDLQGNIVLAAAMARHPAVFDDVEVALVEAAAHTGELVPTCAALHERLIGAAEVRDSLVRAMAYPVFVLVASCVLMPLPLWFTESFAAFLAAALWRLLVCAMLIGTVALGVPAAMAQPTVRARVLQWGARIPLISLGLVHRRLALVLDVLARAMRAGVPLPAALEVAGRASGEPEVTVATAKARASLSAGRPLHEAMAALPGLPSEGLALLAAAEKTGHVPEALAEQAAAWLTAWRRDLRLGGMALRFGLSLLVFLAMAASIVGQFQQVLADPLSMVPGQEGKELRKEMERAFQQLPKEALPQP